MICEKTNTRNRRLKRRVFWFLLALAVLAVMAVLAGLWLIVTDRKAAPVEETK